MQVANDMDNGLIIVLAVVLVVLYCLSEIDRRKKQKARQEQTGTVSVQNVPEDHGTECCGKHAVCEKQKLAEARLHAAQYFDDEELDRFCGRQGFDYTDDEVEEFRYVLYTMRHDEVRQWMECLQARDIELPDMLKEEAYTMMNEQ